MSRCECGHFETHHRYAVRQGKRVRCQRTGCPCRQFAERCECGDCVTCEFRRARERSRARKAAA